MGGGRSGLLNSVWMPQVLDGLPVRAQILESLKPRVKALSRPPGLAVVLVGDDAASGQYVRNKIRACAELGVYSEKLTPPAGSTTEELLAIIHAPLRLTRAAPTTG